jgi:5'-nucleotidase
VFPTSHINRLFSTLAVAVAAANFCHALNILVNNDDGFGSANIRELYRLLRAAGHDSWMVAPAVDNSGQGARLIFTTNANLTNSTEFDLIPAGAPSLGPDPHDDHIWYYNGTPAACTAVGLDYVLPKYANFSTPDLLIAGPNFGDNLGTYAYTGSGTIGASYYAVERNIPAIAFSATNPTQSYTTLTNTSNPATWAAELSVKLVGILANATKAGERLLPLGYGLNVNYPVLNESCLNPPWVLSRFTGGAGVSTAAYNSTTGLFTYGGTIAYSIVTEGANQCFNGNCSLPGESEVFTGCASSVTVFTVDYDAPFNALTGEEVEGKLGIGGGSGKELWTGHHGRDGLE